MEGCWWLGISGFVALPLSPPKTYTVTRESGIRQTFYFVFTLFTPEIGAVTGPTARL